MYLQCARLCAQASGTHFHDGVRAEGDAYFVLTNCTKPQGCIALQLQRRHEDGLVTRINAA